MDAYQWKMGLPMVERQRVAHGAPTFRYVACGTIDLHRLTVGRLRLDMDRDHPEGRKERYEDAS